MVFSHTTVPEELICSRECPWMEHGNFAVEALWTNEWNTLVSMALWRCMCMETASLTHPWMAVAPDLNRGGSVGQYRKLARGEPALWTNKCFSGTVSCRGLPGLQFNRQYFYGMGLWIGLQVVFQMHGFHVRWHSKQRWTSILWKVIIFCDQKLKTLPFLLLLPCRYG